MAQSEPSSFLEPPSQDPSSNVGASAVAYCHGSSGSADRHALGAVPSSSPHVLPPPSRRDRLSNAAEIKAMEVWLSPKLVILMVSYFGDQIEKQHGIKQQLKILPTGNVNIVRPNQLWGGFKPKEKSIPEEKIKRVQNADITARQNKMKQAEKGAQTRKELTVPRKVTAEAIRVRFAYQI